MSPIGHCSLIYGSFQIWLTADPTFSLYYCWDQQQIKLGGCFQRLGWGLSWGEELDVTHGAWIQQAWPHRLPICQVIKHNGYHYTHSHHNRCWPTCLGGPVPREGASQCRGGDSKVTSVPGGLPPVLGLLPPHLPPHCQRSYIQSCK